MIDWYVWGYSMYGGYYLQICEDGELFAYHGNYRYVIAKYARENHNLTTLSNSCRVDN